MGIEMKKWIEFNHNNFGYVQFVSKEGAPLVFEMKDVRIFLRIGGKAVAGLHVLKRGKPGNPISDAKNNVDSSWHDPMGDEGEW